MVDKKLIILAISLLVTLIGTGIILGAIFIDDVGTKNILITSGLGILIVQKIVEIFILKETRKISIIILILLIVCLGYKFYL